MSREYFVCTDCDFCLHCVRILFALVGDFRLHSFRSDNNHRRRASLAQLRVGKPVGVIGPIFVAQFFGNGLAKDFLFPVDPDERLTYRGWTNGDCFRGPIPEQIMLHFPVMPASPLQCSIASNGGLICWEHFSQAGNEPRWIVFHAPPSSESMSGLLLCQQRSVPKGTFTGSINDAYILRSIEHTIFKGIFPLPQKSALLWLYFRYFDLPSFPCSDKFRW